MSCNISRRAFASTLVAAAGAPALSRRAMADAPAKPRIICYIGGYTQHGPPGGAGNGQGISVFEMNPDTSSLSPLMTYVDIASPSFLVLSADNRHLYALSEINDFNANQEGCVTAFSVNRSSGELTKLNVVRSGGAVPAHLSIHASGKYVMVANYMGGTVGILPIHPDGSLGDPTDVVHNTGPRMPDRASDNPPGNFAISDHSSAHVHMVASDPSGRFVLACDAGLDRVYVWTLDTHAGRLVPAKTPFIAMTPGSAPRHFAFNEKGTMIYILGEQDSKVVAATFNPQTGEIVPQQTVSTVTPHFRGSTLAAGILLSPQGRYLYVSNRLGDSLASFHVNDDGTLNLVDEIWMHADYGRSMMFDPSGNFLFCANQRSDSVTSFKVNAQTGVLDFTWNFTPVGSPTTFAFMNTI
ncbi:MULTISPECIES: lactonase family protein [Komagataeibacter]|uniref:6-phosphogluconolactonase n=2 Tax=Acetobacteraceae TaxID=433 RepID=A0A347WE40_9PROT|nr:lactonase family protein [Komagataeibacter saccharivorans]AXY23133.1 6-phosphogluconolactonase [Komagataeibacter saccharivorans]PMP98873.1 6-phosphogluconolactonase [Komagataeibacter saccharivorans]PYD50561.1 3-carboxymuconate cyclase [Komagataeibacter saccharivorans]QBL92949.1 6-phosphogluconolactonase [Komagataeibacter saccharivorans]GBQ36633.1 3-carboxymuconate cyclase [Komagataeibacter saccharivorans NRIC 0614]